MLNKLIQKLDVLLKPIPYKVLMLPAILLALAPFSPQPHLLQKLTWLIEAQSFAAVDVFDVFFHLSPTLIMLIKWASHRALFNEDQID